MVSLRFRSNYRVYFLDQYLNTYVLITKKPSDGFLWSRLAEMKKDANN